MIAENLTAIVTFGQLPDLSDDDRLLLPELTRAGIRAEPAVWSNDHIDWSRFSSVVIRSCWDYHHRPQEFLEWLGQVEQLRIPIWNNPNLIRWNHDKVYLRDLEAKGFPVVPTVWIDTNNPVDLPSLLQSRSWDRAVVKPRVSASGHLTVLIGTDFSHQADTIFGADSGVLVQPYLPEIETKGEWSLLFFNKQYSHAVLKRPQSGEFRVQVEHGGSFEAATPPGSFIEVAQAVVDSIPEPLLFARVDGVSVDGRFTLMELELIEPYLFFSADRSAARRFAEVLVNLGERGPLGETDC
jgi:glutathione synthase/RimK-type ligase-like ATP-grasp enzyme